MTPSKHTPTKEEFDALVEQHGYRDACKFLHPSVDLDDIKGIEQHWINNIKKNKDRYSESELAFFESLKEEKHASNNVHKA